MVSSQCLTLGSRNFVDCMIWKTLFKSHWISVSHIQLYECCDLKAISTGKGVIPVLRHWDPASHATSSKMLCFNIRLATFLLTNLMSNQIFWIPVSSTGMTGVGAQLYERCSLGAIPTSGVSSQCPDTGIQLLCNLIKNVCFSVRQLPLAHQLSYKQNFWIPVSSTGMTPFAVQFTFKNECLYSYEWVLG